MMRSPTHEELLGPLPDPPSFPESIEAVEERVRKIIGKVRLIRSLDSPHYVVGRLLKADDERREKQLKSRFPSSWDAPLFDSPFEQRRLRLLNTLFMALAKGGARPTIRGQEGRVITIAVHDHAVGLRLDTPSNLKQDPRYARPAPAEAKAKMKLVILKGAWTSSERWTWEDTGERKIEQDIEEIAVPLVMAAELQHREHRTHHYEWWLERREQIIEEDRLARAKAQREERERQARLAQERIDRLLAEAEALKTAETIRAYVERVLSSAMISVRGTLQREGDVIHVITDRLEDMTPLLHSVGAVNFPHRPGAGDAATHGGYDPRERLARTRDLYPQPFRVNDQEQHPIPLKTRDFH